LFREGEAFPNLATLAKNVQISGDKAVFHFPDKIMSLLRRCIVGIKKRLEVDVSSAIGCFLRGPGYRSLTHQNCEPRGDSASESWDCKARARYEPSGCL